MRQASALSPLSPIMFIVVIELVSRKVSVKDNQRKLLYADDLAVIVESKQEMQEAWRSGMMCWRSID